MAHPRMYDDSSPVLRRLREICLALPEAFEKEAWGECTFRVNGGSMFAMSDNHHHGSEHVAVWVKAPLGVQEILVHADAERFFVPPYMGSKGWVGVRLDHKVDWQELAGIVEDGYLMSAPKRLQARVRQEAPGAATKRSSPSSRETDSGKTKPAAPAKRRSKKTTTVRHRGAR